MRQAADTGTCSDTSAVKGIDACGRTVVCRLRADAFNSCALTTVKLRSLDDIRELASVIIIRKGLLGTYRDIESPLGLVDLVREQPETVPAIYVYRRNHTVVVELLHIAFVV